MLVAGLGSPAGVLPDAHAQGMVVMALAGNVRQATRMAAEGVDIIIAQGHEAGGHTGRVGTMALVPQVVDAVDVPVLAAGGIADGRGLVAALALGACGVWMGTRFIASVEALAHDNYKNKIVGHRRGRDRGQPVPLRQAVPADPQPVHRGVGDPPRGHPALPAADDPGGGRSRPPGPLRRTDRGGRHPGRAERGHGALGGAGRRHRRAHHGRGPLGAHRPAGAA